MPENGKIENHSRVNLFVVGIFSLIKNIHGIAETTMLYSDLFYEYKR